MPSKSAHDTQHEKVRDCKVKDYSIHRYSTQLAQLHVKPKHTFLSFLCPRPRLVTPADALRAVLTGSPKGPVNSANYRHYLIFHEFGSEGLDFWIAVQQLKRTESVIWIIQNFLVSNAPNEINIDDLLRRRTIERLRANPRDHTPLRAVQMVVFELLESSFIRFLEYLEHGKR